MSYNDLWKAIIRPPRESYRILDLGDQEFTMANRNFIRTDFTLLSIRGLKIIGSHYEPIESERISPILPCVIYLHGNCSSRLEAQNSIFLLTGNITLVSIDFPGCGLSEGEYISLGWFEQHDLANLVDYLREERRVGSIGIWGRSMGAVTAILYASTNPKGIEALALDSPFGKLKGVAMHLSKSHAKYVPNFILKIGYKMVRKSIKSRAKFDIEKLKPVKYVEKIKIPAIIAYSTNDELVPCKQFEKIQVKYGGPNIVSIFRGGHNDMRSLEFCTEVGIFFCKHLKTQELKNTPISIPPHWITEDVMKKAQEFEANSKRGDDDDVQKNMLLTMTASRYYSTIPSKNK